jgi:hypothetical protein
MLLLLLLPLVLYCICYYLLLLHGLQLLYACACYYCLPLKLWVNYCCLLR